MEISWLMHESPALKPDWLAMIKLFWIKNLNIQLQSNLSRTYCRSAIEILVYSFLVTACHFFYGQEQHLLFSIR